MGDSSTLSVEFTEVICLSEYLSITPDSYVKGENFETSINCIGNGYRIWGYRANYDCPR